LKQLEFEIEERDREIDMHKRQMAGLQDKMHSD